ncbi:MAG: hypothetical protein WC712_13055 [Candidatus Brocadiia bacterium]
MAEKKEKNDSSSSKAGSKAGSSIWLKLFFALVALLALPILVSCFVVLVSYFKHPDFSSSVFGHSKPMLFFFAGIFVYCALHLALGDAGRKGLVDADPGSKLWGSLSGGDDALGAFIPMLLPIYTILALIAFYGSREIWPSVGDYFPIFCFVVGLTWSYHLLAGLTKIFSGNGGAASTGPIFALVFAVIINIEVLFGLWCLIFGKANWITFNQEVYGAAVGMYSDAWHWTATQYHNLTNSK